MRLFLYNFFLLYLTQSRTYSTRGARNVSLHLDNVCVFKGELRCGEGTLEVGNYHPAEAIYLVNEPKKAKLVEIIAHYDREELDFSYPDISTELAMSIVESSNERPNTASKSHMKTTTDTSAESLKGKTSLNSYNLPKETSSILGRSISISLLAPHGKSDFVGLCAVKVEGNNGYLSIDSKMVHPSEAYKITSKPETANELPNVSNMWLAKHGSKMEICFDEVTSLKALHIWNYNDESATDFGARIIKVLVDGKPVGSDGIFFLRRAPGHSLVPFRQTIQLGLSSNNTITAKYNVKHSTKISISQDYEVQSLPRAMLLRIVIHNSWGDAFYVGLDGIEVPKID